MLLTTLVRLCNTNRLVIYLTSLPKTNKNKLITIKNKKIMETTVRNLLNSKDIHIYVNELGPVDNMVNAIIFRRNQTSNLLNEEFRSNVVKEFNLVERVSKNGDLICFCEELGLFARQQINN